MKKTILLFGGSSDERLVSVASAQNLAQQYDFSEIVFLHSNGALMIISQEELLSHTNPFEREFVTDRKPFAANLNDGLHYFTDAIIFIALHGNEGEDGTIQALFESANVCFTGSGSTASKHAFEKDTAKKIVKDSNIMLAPQLLIDSKKDYMAVSEFLHTHKKIVLKPIANGSSLGVYIVSNEAELLSSWKNIDGLNYMVEKFIDGRELTVAIIEDEHGIHALCPSEIILNKNRTFDYKGKYLGLGVREITPARISSAEEATVQNIALHAHKILGCYGYSRTDIILSGKTAFFLETNTLPGLSKASFVPQQLTYAKIPIKDFIKAQLLLAEKRYF